MKGDELKRTIESLFQVVKERCTPDEIVFICPVPGCGDESGNRSTNLKSGRTNCWRCNKAGDFVKWAKFLGYSIEEGTSSVGVALENVDLRPWVPQAEHAPVVRDIPLPEGFHFCSDYPNSVYTQLIGEMAERKNLSLEDLLAARVGFTQKSIKWEPYALFPVFDYDRVVYWQGRTYDDVPGATTKRFPDKTEAPYGAKYWVYGVDELRRDKSSVVIVVESILNVLSLRRYMHENGLAGATPVCVFKHYLSAPQARKIIELPFVEEICLLYDHDATRSAWQKSVMIGDYVRTTVAQMPPGPGGAKNDPNDDVATAWEVFERRTRADRLASTLGQGLDYRLGTGMVEPRPQPLDRLQNILGSSEHESRNKTVRRQGRFTAGG